MVRRPLEEEASIGAAELDLDVAIVGERAASALRRRSQNGERSGLT